MYPVLRVRGGFVGRAKARPSPSVATADIFREDAGVVPEVARRVKLAARRLHGQPLLNASLMHYPNCAEAEIIWRRVSTLEKPCLGPGRSAERQDLDQTYAAFGATTFSGPASTDSFQLTGTLLGAKMTDRT
jgi:hypothetical protein